MKLRYIIPPSQISQRESARPEQIRRWTELSFSKPPPGDESLQLPMSEELASRFDGCVSSMRTLALDAIFTLHVNIRFIVIHTITRMLEAPYVLHHPTNNPDPSVLSLSADLLNLDEDLAGHISIPEHHFVTRGLAALIDTFLVTNASQIKSIDEFGCGRMQINILVLQQNLKAIEGDVSLSRSAQFFDLFTEGPDVIVAKAKADGGRDLDFSLEEMKTLVELCYSQGLQSPQREVIVQAKRGLSERLLELGG